MSPYSPMNLRVKRRTVRAGTQTHTLLAHCAEQEQIHLSVFTAEDAFSPDFPTLSVPMTTMLASILSETAVWSRSAPCEEEVEEEEEEEKLLLLLLAQSGSYRTEQWAEETNHSPPPPPPSPRQHQQQQ